MTTNISYDRLIRVQVAGLVLEDLRIDGEMDTSADSQQTTGELTIYNLSREKSNLIDKDQRITIDAGYLQGGGASRLYEGVVQRVWRTRGETSFQTKIQLGDALHAANTKGGNTEHTFEGVESTRNIAQSLAKDMGLETGPLDAIPADDTRTNFRASGKTSESMQKLVEGTQGLGWMVDSVGLVRFTNGADPQPDGFRVVVSPTTGMVGIPDIEEDRRTSITTLLNAKTRVGGEVVVEGSEFIDATPLTIVGVQHTFSNWTGKFLTHIDAVPKDYNPDGDDSEENTEGT